MAFIKDNFDTDPSDGAACECTALPLYTCFSQRSVALARRQNTGTECELDRVDVESHCKKQKQNADERMRNAYDERSAGIHADGTTAAIMLLKLI